MKEVIQFFNDVWFCRKNAKTKRLVSEYILAKRTPQVANCVADEALFMLLKKEKYSMYDVEILLFAILEDYFNGGKKFVKEDIIHKDTLRINLLLDFVFNQNYNACVAPTPNGKTMQTLHNLGLKYDKTMIFYAIIEDYFIGGNKFIAKQ